MPEHSTSAPNREEIDALVEDARLEVEDREAYSRCKHCGDLSYSEHPCRAGSHEWVHAGYRCFVDPDLLRRLADALEAGRGETPGAVSHIPTPSEIVTHGHRCIEPGCQVWTLNPERCDEHAPKETP